MVLAHKRNTGPRAFYPTRFNRQYDQIMARINEDPSLPPFFPETRPENVTPRQWLLLITHLRDKRVLKAIGRDMELSQTVIAREIETGFHHLRQHWENLQTRPREPETNRHRIEATITVEGPIDREQAEKLATRWHLMSQRLMISSTPEPVEATITLRIS